MEKKKLSRRDFLAGIGVSAGALGLTAMTASCTKPSAKKALSMSHGNDSELFPEYDGEKYIPKDFSHLAKNTELGLSEENITHHVGLYNKYIVKVNKSEAMMAAGEIDEFAMKNLAFSLNGMALHDIYFSNMTTEKTSMSSALSSAIENTFGSFEAYMKNLTEQAMKVKGWSMTGLNLLNGKIYNYAEDTHSSNYPAYFMPIMVLDVYDHAWVKQFGEDDSAKMEYINVFKNIINWDLVSRRFDAVSMVFN